MSKTLEEIITSPSLVREQWLSPELAVREVLAFERRFGSKHLMLACHAALPLILTPELVNLIHLNFLEEEQIPWVAEVDFLLSALCRPIDEGLYEVEPSVREVLLVELENQFGFERPFGLAKFLEVYLADKLVVQQRSEVTRTQWWIAQAYLDPDSLVVEMNKFFQSSLFEQDDAISLPKQIQLVTTLEILTEPLERTNRQTEYQYLVNSSRVVSQSIYGYIDETIVQQKIIDNLRQSEARERDRAAQLELLLQELQRTQIQLIQFEKRSSLGQVLVGVVHEINNPLTFIHGNIAHAKEYVNDLFKLVELYTLYYPQPVQEIQEFTEAIDLDFLAEDFPKLLKSMDIGANHIRQIIQSLRSFSSLDQAEYKAVDIHEGIENTLMILHNRLKPAAANIKLVKNYGNLPPVECYAGELNQVFINILSNAIDALEELGSASAKSEQQTPTIRINTSVEGENVVIQIADNASGMSQKIVSRIFDPFFTTKPVGKGSGLGLAISYQIVVEKHGGNLSCISQPGLGTEFIIEIPISARIFNRDAQELERKIKREEIGNDIPNNDITVVSPRFWQWLADVEKITINQQTINTLQQNEARVRERVTRLKLVLQELKQTQSQLIQAEKMSSLGQLVAGVVHEVNNPVTFIHGNIAYVNQYADDLFKLLELYILHYPQPVQEIQDFTEAIDFDFLVEDFPKLLKSMDVGANRIFDIVQSLKTFTPLERTGRKTVDIHEGIENILMILHNRLKTAAANIKLVKNYGDLPPVECYAGQINQVFMNILTNAIDALEELRSASAKSEQQTPTIRINTSVQGENVVIRIADNGSGISPKLVSKIFDPFFTTKPVGKGSGLGLSISYQIVVEKHGGKLSCVSELGVGTEFIIEIPLTSQTRAEVWV